MSRRSAVNLEVDPQIAAAERRLSFECVEPNRIAGVPIGAINAAIVAGNPAEQRIEDCANSGNKWRPTDFGPGWTMQDRNDARS
jgi:predicted acylesterase/phospholipase RssA